MRLFVLLLALIVAAPLAAQPVLSDSARVALVTIEPGQDVYARWGHTAIRVQDPATGFDRLYNYGTFQFDQFFVFRFAYGQLDYLLSVADPYDAYYAYAQYEGRSIIEQTLRLTPGEARDLVAFLEWNARPENRTYRYDFLFDNCSTRPRDAVERVLGRKLRYPSPTLDATFRDLIDPFVAATPALDTGLDLLLGLPVDRRATARQATFLPDSLRTLFDAALVETAAGPASLVVRTDTVFWNGPGTARRAFPLHALLIAGLAAVGIALSWRGRDRLPGRLLRLSDALLFGVLGVAGLLMAFLWFVSLHHVTGPNLNVLWAWPTHLVAAFALARRTLPRWLPPYLRATALVTALTCLAWPLLPQLLPPALWPLAALAAVRAGSRSRPNHQNAPTLHEARSAR